MSEQLRGAIGEAPKETDAELSIAQSYSTVLAKEMQTSLDEAERRFAIAMDAYPPAEMARKVESVGVAKGKLDLASMFALALLAGAFIAFAANLFTLTVTGSPFGFGPTRLLGGLTFSLGLILVVVGGAELFTGNNMMVMAWARGKLSMGRVLLNWLVVYLGNLVGSLVIVLLVYYSAQWSMNGYGVGATAVQIANAKVDLGFVEAFSRGILCNALVCLAVWLCYGARGVTDKIMAIVFPITAFVACGFEHSIANMYFIPIGIALKNDPVVLQAAGLEASQLLNLTAAGFVQNLIPVTLGNIVGGVVFVAAVYWFIYLRHEK